MAVQDLRIDQIADAVNRRIPRAAGITTIAVWPDLDHVRVEIQADRPGVGLGHSRAEYDRLRAELEELTGKPVQLRMVKDAGPPKRRKEIQLGPGHTSG
jgi:ribosomal protein S3